LRPNPGWSDEIFVTEDRSRSSLTVHPSLLEALRQLRHNEETVVLWVDLLCINWIDKIEAEIQGELIPDIFQRASDVVVWLGEGTDDSSTAIQFIPDLLNLSLIDSLVREESTPGKWQALIDLMKWPYFSRRWVFLELMLAKRAVLYCGSETVDWGDFADAVVILGSRYDEVRLLVRAALSLEYVVFPQGQSLSVKPPHILTCSQPKQQAGQLGGSPKPGSLLHRGGVARALPATGRRIEPGHVQPRDAGVAAAGTAVVASHIRHLRAASARDRPQALDVRGEWQSAGGVPAVRHALRADVEIPRHHLPAVGAQD
jgi:hypothetical protein